jgi:hypothetical protein
MRGAAKAMSGDGTHWSWAEASIRPKLKLLELVAVALLSFRGSPFPAVDAYPLLFAHARSLSVTQSVNQSVNQSIHPPVLVAGQSFCEGRKKARSSPFMAWPRASYGEREGWLTGLAYAPLLPASPRQA